MMPAALEEGVQLPIMIRRPTAVDLFMFSAAAWLIHRIHYDASFTTEHDGHPALLIHGPLQGTYMVQCAQSWLGPSASLRELEYRHRAPAYLGEALECGGSVARIADTATVELDLWAAERGLEKIAPNVLGL